eukprot:TRINITY_DN70093_c0_g1_i1.p1 TRINITY_DN70093_c0_g1~~TRINITY_DN70093_c0_g1_i1.p1  ORF type:complete len:406 (+),score=69.20 TRINITY_DN70093_c0_g1_i1:75-1292(+)
MSRIAIIFGLLTVMGGAAAFVLYFYKDQFLAILGLKPAPRGSKQLTRDKADIEDGSGDPESSRTSEHLKSGGHGSSQSLGPMIVVAADDKGRGETLSYASIEAACGMWSKDRVIGEGGGATVFRAEMPRYGTVAVKRFKTASDGVGSFEREIEALSVCRHPNILEIIGVASDGPEDILVMPLMDGGTLTQACPELPWYRRSIIVGQVVRAVSFLHGKDIIHRDVKSSNVLLDMAQRKARLSDFGLAKSQVKANSSSTTGMVFGSPGYMAPELMMRRANEKTDSYAMGVVVLEVLTAMHAWDGAGGMALTDTVCESGEFDDTYLDGRANWPNEEAKILSNFANSMTLFDPARRLTCGKLEEEPLFIDHIQRAEVLERRDAMERRGTSDTLGGDCQPVSVLGAPSDP